VALSVLYSSPYYGGSASTVEVPGRYPVALGGRGYNLDLRSGKFGWQSIALMRQQFDTSDRPGERSLNPEAGWRRAQESWHLGAGQAALDRAESDPYRFATSKGVDPWDEWELGLLPDTTEVVDTTSTNLALAATGTRLWLSDDDDVRYTDDGTSWSAATYGGGDIVSIASTGSHVYVSDGANVYRCAAAGTDFSSAYNTLDADLLRFVNGRLMAAHDDSIYEIVSGSAPTAHYQHPNAAATWVDFAEGPSAIYAAAQVGDVGFVYRIGVDPTAGTLEVPVVVAQFVGETILSLHGYAGTVLLIGTGDGFRVATYGTGGSLSVGARVPTGVPCRAFSGHQEYVWFGWEDFDADNSGLGRIDLSRFTSDINVFAYASDLMADDDGAVTSILTFDGRRFFAVSGAGVYAEAATLVASGWFTTGEISYGLPADKTLERVLLAGDAAAVVSVDLDVDGSGWSSLGSIALSQSTEMGTGLRTGERFDLRFTIARGSAASVKLRRWALEAEPSASGRLHIFAPLLIAEQESVWGGATGARDVTSDVDHVIALWSNQVVTTWQEGYRQFPVRVTDIEWSPAQQTSDRGGWNGTLLVKMKKV